MIDEKFYKRIEKTWCGRIYQAWSKEKHRLEHFTAVAPLFEGKRVIDIGCNAGLHAVEICEYADSYLGIEAKPDYYIQALQTRKFIDHPECLFVRANAIDYIVKNHPACDALLMSFVIYHLTDDEIEVLRKKILPGIPLLVVYNRVDRPTIKNSWNLHEPDKMVVFLRDNGYDTEFHWGRKNLFYSIVARRKEKT